jgi:hypothetical protein
MSTNLAVDKLEPALRLGDLLTESSSQLGKQVTMFAGSGFGIEVQLGDIAGQQRVPLGIEGSDVALSVLDLPRDAVKLRGSAFPGDGGIDLAVIVKQTLQGFDVATAVGLVGAGHQQRKVLLLGLIPCEVGVNTLRDIAKESFETRRRVELFGLASIAECGIMGLLRPLAGLLGAAACGVGVVEVYLTLRDPSLKRIQLSVENADLTEITAFKGLELEANLGKLGFALGKLRPNGSKLLALVEQRNGVRALLENDFGWHAAPVRG